MRNKALDYYKEGYNCSQCILKAAEEKYNIYISEENLNLCKGINNGFGIGGLCSLVTGGIMVFGLLFDEATVKRLRLKLLDNFYDKYLSLNCCQLKGRDENSCQSLVYEVADIIDNIINQEMKF